MKQQHTIVDHRFAIYLIRAILVLYIAFMSFMLLVTDPWAMLGITFRSGPASESLTHLKIFTLLGFLASAAQLPVRRRTFFAILLGFATGMELMQWSNPNRVVELVDWIENIAGCGLGFLSWHTFMYCWHALWSSTTEKASPQRAKLAKKQAAASRLKKQRRKQRKMQRKQQRNG